MVIPDAETVGGAIAFLMVAVAGYKGFAKSSKERKAWEREDCEQAVAEAFAALEIRHAEEQQAMRAKLGLLDLSNAHHSQRIRALEYDKEEGHRIHDALENRLWRLEMGRHAPPAP